MSMCFSPLFIREPAELGSQIGGGSGQRFSPLFIREPAEQEMMDLEFMVLGFQSLIHQGAG